MKTALPSATDEPEQPVSSLHVVRTAQLTGAWCVAVLLAAGVVFCLAVPLLWPYDFRALYAAFAAAVLLTPLCAVRAVGAQLTAASFEADEDELAQYDGAGAVSKLKWSAIARVRLRLLGGWLEVSDASGRTTLRLPCCLEGYDDIARHAVACCRPPGKRPPSADRLPQQVFHPTHADALTPLIAPVLVALSIIIFGNVLLLVWLVAASAVLFSLSGWQRIRLETDALVIRSGFRAESVPLCNIDDLLLWVEDPRTDLRPALLIHCTDGDVLKIAGIREGEHALHDALVAALPPRPRPAVAQAAGAAVVPSEGA